MCSCEPTVFVVVVVVGSLEVCIAFGVSLPIVASVWLCVMKADGFGEFERVSAYADMSAAPAYGDEMPVCPEEGVTLRGGGAVPEVARGLNAGASELVGVSAGELTTMSSNTSFTS